MKHRIGNACILPVFFGVFLFQQQGFADKCGGNRDDYLGTYKGRVATEFAPNPTDADLAKSIPLKLFVNARRRNNYTLTVRFYKKGADYWVESTVQFDDSAKPAHKHETGYLLSLTSSPSKIEFTVARQPSAVVGEKPMPTVDVNEKTVKDAARSGRTILDNEKLVLDALDCAPGGNVPRRLFFSTVTKMSKGALTVTDKKELKRVN